MGAQRTDGLSPALARRVEVLRRILQEERRRGFPDRVVTGGLDRFLEDWRRELEQAEEREALRRLHRLGLFSTPYAALSPAEREAWAEAVLRGLERLAEPAPGPEAPAPQPPPPALRRLPTPRGLSLDSPVKVVPGVGPQIARSLQEEGVRTVRDLLYFLPRRHIPVVRVRDLVPGEEVGIVGVLWTVQERALGERQVPVTEAVLSDETGNLRVVWWNQPFVAKALRPDQRVFVTGRVNLFRGQPTLEATGHEVLEEEDPLLTPGRLVPLYPSVRRAGARKGEAEYLSPRTVRRVVRTALETWLPRLEDFLPPELREGAGLLDLTPALLWYHYPEGPSALERARRRLAFDELFLAQVVLLQRKRAWQSAPAHPIPTDRTLLDAFLASLPFELTGAQRRALEEVLADIARPRPMSRLLQGEVGSGKTVVALSAMLMAFSADLQSAMMAPTEVLAEQHFLTLARLLAGLGEREEKPPFLLLRLPDGRTLTVALLLGSLRKREKEEVQRALAEGRVNIVVGTHALIQEGVAMPRLALAVVDEQQRFGVLQRQALREKGTCPHLLAMSATPIPRTLALTLYGDLDLSVIDELPPGRQRVRTRWLRPEQEESAYRFIRQQVQEGRQAYIICPLIQESEALQTRAVLEEYERLRTQVFPDLRVGLLHGRMPLREKQEVMDRFRRGDLDILVATPVIEVGVDVPNATVMLIEGAERFGLSELHQFRGRVGRGPHPAYCLLLADNPSPEAQERLRIFEQEVDGFRVAEADMRLRGPGELWGVRQSGLPDLRVATLEDRDLLETARRWAERLLEEDPHLTRPEHRPLRKALEPYLRAVPQRVELS